MSNPPPWLPELITWESADYDGIKGTPPEWVPEPAREKFSTERLGVFLDVVDSAYTYANALGEVERHATDRDYRLILALVKSQGGSVSLQATRTIFLGHLLQCVRLGTEKGLRLLAGSEAVSGWKSAAARPMTKASRAANSRARVREAQTLAAKLLAEGIAPSKINGLVGTALRVKARQAANLRKNELPEGNCGP